MNQVTSKNWTKFILLDFFQALYIFSHVRCHLYVSTEYEIIQDLTIWYLAMVAEWGVMQVLLVQVGIIRTRLTSKTHCSKELRSIQKVIGARGAFNPEKL